MLVFRHKRAPPGPTQVPCPVPLAALRTPPDNTWCIGTTYAGRRRRTDGGRDASLALSPDSGSPPVGRGRCSYPCKAVVRTYVRLAVVTVTAGAEPLDRLTDALGAHFNIRLSRLALDRLNVEIEGAAYPVVRLRVEAKLRELGIANVELT